VRSKVEVICSRGGRTGLDVGLEVGDGRRHGDDSQFHLGQDASSHVCEW